MNYCEAGKQIDLSAKRTHGNCHVQPDFHPVQRFLKFGKRHSSDDGSAFAANYFPQVTIDDTRETPATFRVPKIGMRQRCMDVFRHAYTFYVSASEPTQDTIRDHKLVNVDRTLSDMKTYRERLNVAILALEQLALGEMPRRGRPPKWKADAKRTGKPTPTKRPRKES